MIEESISELETTFLRSHLTVLSTTSYCFPSLKKKMLSRGLRKVNSCSNHRQGWKGWWSIMFENDAQFPGESVWFRREGQNRKGRKKASTVSSSTQHVPIQPLLHRPIWPCLSVSSCFPGKHLVYKVELNSSLARAMRNFKK